MRVAPTLVAALLALPPVTAGGQQAPCGTRREGARAALALHRYAQQARALAGHDTFRADSRARDTDVAHVAVLEDQGDLVVRRNTFDLDQSALRFEPNATGGFDVRSVSGRPEPAGEPIPVSTGGAALVDLPFDFPFFGRAERRVFVQADGNLTFGQAALGSAPGLSDFLSGPPRLAALFASLDPSRGGTISARLLADRAVFDWRDVPGAGQINRNSFQAVLYPNGTIDVLYGPIETREGVVGVSPGGVFEVTAAELARGEPRGSTGALAEVFSESEKVDLVAVARRFYRSHPDIFEQLIVYTTRPLNPVPGTLAFELNVKNEILGIGLPVEDRAADYGSSGALRSLVHMDAIDPYLEVDGFEILGHEVGHRWGARLQFGTAGAVNSSLLGRGGVHWSFFADTDASVLEGNDIEDGGGGRFETVAIARGYSALDLYAMGLRSAAEVPPFFYVESPDDFRPNRGYKATSGPEPGVSFTGVRRDVRIEEVVAALGPRMPSAEEAPRLLRQAFILIADETGPATPERLLALARIRSRFEPWYHEATGGRGEVDSTLP
jgi:hypothetical protein